MSEFPWPGRGHARRIIEAHRQRSLTKMLGQVTCEGDHSDCAPDENGWHAFTCVHCGAAL